MRPVNIVVLGIVLIVVVALSRVPGGREAGGESTRGGEPMADIAAAARAPAATP